MASTDTANTNIFQRLQQLSQFQPATANLFADWTLDPGDVVTVQQGDKSYLMPIYQMNLDWKGQSMVEVQSTGSEQRPPLSELKRRSYAGGKRASETEKTLIEHKAGIEKSDERLLLWATESQWSQMAADQVVTQKSQFEITADTISSTVTGVVAEQFSSTRSYAVGDVCKYGGRLWTFQAAHQGLWNPADVVDSVNLNGSLASHQSQITQTRDSISLVVDETTGKITPASLKLAINGDTSTIKLSADAIDINGVVTRLTGADVSFGDCEVTGTLTGHLTGDVEGNLDGDIIGEGHEGYFENGVYVGSSFLPVNVVDVQVNGNTLLITYADGTTVPFSKAVAQHISGSWSSGVYSAGPDASSSTDTVSTDLFERLVNVSQTKSGKNINISGQVFTATVVSGQRVADSSTGRTVQVTADASEVWQDGYIAGGGGVTLASLAVTNDTSTGHPITYNDTTTPPTISFYPKYRLSNQSQTTYWSKITINDPGLYNSGHTDGWNDALMNLEPAQTVEPSATAFTVSPTGSNIGLNPVTVSAVTIGSRSTTAPSGKRPLGTLTLNGYYPVASDGYFRVNVPSGQVGLASIARSGGHDTYDMDDTGLDNYPLENPIPVLEAGKYYRVVATAQNGERFGTRFRAPSTPTPTPRRATSVTITPIYDSGNVHVIGNRVSVSYNSGSSTYFDSTQTKITSSTTWS